MVDWSWESATQAVQAQLSGRGAVGQAQDTNLCKTRSRAIIITHTNHWAEIVGRKEVQPWRRCMGSTAVETMIEWRMAGGVVGGEKHLRSC